LAPFLGFLEELRWFQKRSTKSADAPPNVLLFGCRDENMDYIHRDTLEVQQRTAAPSTILSLPLTTARRLTTKA
jgi:sulfite reductase alpha subunit-like flavoprotein